MYHVHFYFLASTNSIILPSFMFFLSYFFAWNPICLFDIFRIYNLSYHLSQCCSYSGSISNSNYYMNTQNAIVSTQTRDGTFLNRIEKEKKNSRLSSGYAVTRIRTWVVAATTRSTNHYTITASTPAGCMSWQCKLTHNQCFN